MKRSTFLLPLFLFAAYDDRACRAEVLLADGTKCIESSQCSSICCARTLLIGIFFGQDNCGPPGLLSWCLNSHEFDSSKTEGLQCSEVENEGGGLVSFFIDLFDFFFGWLFDREGEVTLAPSPLQTTSPSTSTRDVLKIMTYNMLLILLAPDLLTMGRRVDDIANFFKERGGEEDVLVLQEVWLKSSKIKRAMVEAGYCHYAADFRGQFGSGMAIYSKLPIEKQDFRPYADATSSLDALIDRGVIYAKVNKSGTSIHIFGTHTISDARGSNHEVRRRQYAIMRRFIDEKDVSDTDLVLMAGDFNEDKSNAPGLFSVMLADLGAEELTLIGGRSVSYNDATESNSFFREGETSNQVLDFILFDKSSSAIPGNGTQCEYLKPVNEVGEDLSDHYPMACRIELSWSNGIVNKWSC